MTEKNLRSNSALIESKMDRLKIGQIVKIKWPYKFDEKDKKENKTKLIKAKIVYIHKPNCWFLVEVLEDKNKFGYSVANIDYSVILTDDE